MASWRCSICGFVHGAHEETCFGCHHPGTSLEHFIDCRECGNENKVGTEWCGWCNADLQPDENDEFDDGDGDDDDWNEED